MSFSITLAIGFFLLPSKWSIPLFGQYKFTPWRLQMLLYTTPGLIGGLILIALPESPNYLLAIGRTVEGFEALDWICMKSIGLPLAEIIKSHSNRSTIKSTISMFAGIQIL